MYIGIDFDGTCVTHEFPKIGRDNEYAEDVLKAIVRDGHDLILFTMRSDIDNPTSLDSGIIPKGGNYLAQAVKWFKDRNIPLYGVNTNPTQKTWTSSPKAYCHVYIDDAALGVPLLISEGERPRVNWEMVRELLIVKGILQY